MKIHELLRLLLWPLAGLCLLLTAHMFFTHYTQGMFPWLDYLNSIIDLREERTVGTWFETMLFALTGLTFFLVSRHPVLSVPGRFLLMLMALGFCFLSADEALVLHEFMGYELEQATGIVRDTALDRRGYAWVLLYIPAALAVCGFISRQYYRIFRSMRSRTAAVLYLLAWAAVGLVVLCEVADGWSILQRSRSTLLPCFEEFFELAFLLFFYSTNLLIAEEADL